MTVTKVDAVTKNKYKVYVDEQFAFVLYKGELSRYHLAVHEEISEELYQTIMTEVVLKRAKLRALYLLNSMGRTESQLRQKLKEDLYPEEIMEAAISYVKSFGYINDDEYARSFIDSRKDKKSKKEIYMQLSQKGLDKEMLDTVFEKYYDSDDSKEAIRSLMRKKRYDSTIATREETRKMMGYLTRKGFSYEDIRQVLHVSEWNA